MTNLTFENWGLVEYADALSRQEKLVEEIALGQKPECIVLCSHPEVVTTGRATAPSDLLNWSGPTFEVTRGGRATFHAPNQIVIYPLLKTERVSLSAILRGLESGVIRWLESFDIVGAEARPLRLADGETEPKPATGVWVGDHKVAAIGLAVRKWVSYHGLAVNFEPAPLVASLIRPCGFRPGSVISFCELWAERHGNELAPPHRLEAERSLLKTLTQVLG